MSGETKNEVQGLPIANIVLGEIIDEVTGKTYYFDTASKADTKPDISAGKEDILRVKNRILAMNRTEDICIGYDIKLTNSTFTPELMVIIDGGEIVGEKGYSGPEVGKPVKRHPYTLNLYAEEKDYDSETISYVKFTYKHNKGKPVDIKFEDGKFFVPEFESHSRPKKGERPVYINFIKELPIELDEDGNVKPDPKPDTTPTMEVKGGSVEQNNKDVSVKITSNIKWTFNKEIDQDEVTTDNFVVTNKQNNKVASGNVTINEDKKVVTFVPISVEKGATYTAEARPIKLLDKSGVTTAIKVEFTTI